MMVCKETNLKKAKILVKSLNEENWWLCFKYNKKSGEITETPILGEKLFELFHHKVLFKHYEITAMVGHKEYYICEKNKSWEKGETYNPEITNAFWEAYSQGLITGRKEKLSKKQQLKVEENGKIK